MCGRYRLARRKDGIQRRLVAAFRIRRAACPKFSWAPALAAATLRSLCVLAHGCPVLRVHFSFGLARHTGQRTDNICRNVSFLGLVLVLFNIITFENRQLCYFDFIICTNINCKDRIRYAQPILFVPEKLPDLSVWLRWICLDFLHHMLEGLPSLELLSGKHKTRLFP